MKRKIFNILIFALFLYTSQICFAKTPRLVIVGSTTLLPLSEHLATHYQKKGIADVLVQGGGSTAGINAVKSSIAQIGASSRKLSEEEAKDLQTFEIARDAIAIVVHPQNPISNLTIEQLKDVLSGKIKNWNELGIPLDKPIQLINDSAGSGTRAAIEQLVMGKSKEKKLMGTPISLMSVVTNSSSEMKLNITKSKYAIGYLPFSYLDQNVKALSINASPPTYAAAYKGEYPLFRFLYYVTKKKSYGLELAYIYYVLSHEGQDIVVQEGFLPLKLITSVRQLDRINKVPK